MNIFILVPVYNEGSVFEEWLPKLLQVAGDLDAKVLVIDDGSDTRMKEELEEKAGGGKYVCLRHMVNCGVGAAIGTGMEYAKRHGAEMVLTIDGDGQHDPRDLAYIMDKLKEGNVDIVNGSRFLKNQRIPLLRRIANFMGNLVTFLLSGIWISDTQSGMKGFSKRALDKININAVGYEWCSGVFREAAWHHLKIEELPISVKYNLYTMRKGQGFAVGLDVLARLFMRSLIRR